MAVLVVVTAMLEQVRLDLGLARSSFTISFFDNLN